MPTMARDASRVVGTAVTDGSSMGSGSARGTGQRRVAATIGDVATAAGVSRATVSRVMNGRSTVDATIAERVRGVAADLSYRPSNAARSLALGRTQTVALVVPDLGNPVFQQILRGVMDGAAEDGYRVLVADTVEDDQQEGAIALEARMRCDALVLVSPRIGDAELSALIADVEPVVLVNRETGGTAPSLVVDYEDGAVQVAEHLVALGHRRIVYLGGPVRSASDELRRAGLARARERYADLEIIDLPAGPDIQAGHAAAPAVLATRATAAVAFNDLVAFGLLAGLNEAGVAVPADISVAGFDDIELSRYATPALTTVAVPQAELGRHAWRELHAVIDDDAHPASSARFTPSLEVRGSTGPVPQGPERVHLTDDGDAAVGQPDEIPTVPPTATPVWSVPADPEADAVVLTCGDGLELVRRDAGDRMPKVHARRPYLHPVHTLAGVPLTDVSPVDHRHHYGVGIALPDVNGTSYWGGRTFIEDVGPTLLKNHGQQTPEDIRVEPVPGGAGAGARAGAAGIATGAGTGAGIGTGAGAGAGTGTGAGEALVEDVLWSDEHGEPQLREDRRITARLLPRAPGSDAAPGWVLDWRSTLHADHGPLEIRSPATNGRPGAGYGGLFWRLPIAESTTVLSAAGTGESRAHGSTSPWVAFVQQHGGRSTTLLLVQPGQVRPWFLRSAEYPGACPALAWDAPLLVPDGGSVQLDLVAVLLDTELTVAGAETLAADLTDGGGR
ncbi:LacI family transcriptional regulator [Promicromonospora sp. AC04]|nr:LacI family transcriptional regulator [Promicromonospora sp. AC04]